MKNFTASQTKECYDTIKIKLIGIGCLIAKSEVDLETFSKLTDTAERLKTSLQFAIYDAEFYAMLNMKGSNDLYKDKNKFEFYGLVSNPKSQIEIWKNGKRRKTIKFSELENENQLFSEYKVETKKLFYQPSKVQNITLVESCVGSILIFKLQVKNFDLNLLQYRIYDIDVTPISQEKILYNIQYNGQNIKKEMGENFITSRYAVIEPNK